MTMKKFQALLITLLLICTATPAQAIGLSEVSYSTVPVGWDRVYGLAESVEIVPLQQTLDEKVTLNFSKTNIKLPRGNAYREHLGIFHADESFSSRQSFSGTGILDGDDILLEISRTGYYFLAPIIAEEDFNLQASTSVGSVGKPIDVTSSIIIANNDQPIWDEFPFLISTTNATVSGTSVTGNEVKTKGGKIRFTLTPTVDGPIAVALSTDFGDAGAKAVLGQEAQEISKTIPQTIPETPEANTTPVPEIAIESSPEPSQARDENPSMAFPDIAGHWAENSIRQLAEKGIINGYANGNFGPNDPVTRAQLVKIALNAFGIDLRENISNPFSDVDPGQWYGNFVLTALMEGFIAGHPDGRFDPNGFVNRAEGLKIMMKAAGISPDTDDLAEFSDVDQSLWFAPFVNTAVKMGIVQGREEVTQPKTVSAARGSIIVIKENLWPGKTGEEVKKLQTALTIMGHYNGPISGTYDRATLEAVYAFQVAAGIVKTPLDPSRNGSLGEKTRNIFNAQKVTIPTEETSEESSNSGEAKTLKFFDPINSLSRAEVAKIVVKMMGIR
jgi:peptidoglycan hydrolase-like protein with peptidoglycan-binding domain